MTVYVSAPLATANQPAVCYLVADSESELHAAAALIKLPRKLWKAPPQFDSHYPIPGTKHAEALKIGAVQVNLQQLGAMEIRHRIEGKLGSPSDAESWVRDYFATLRSAS